MDERASLVLIARDLDHDLGRYVFFQLAAVTDDVASHVFVQAAIADIVTTRMTLDGSHSAWEIWEVAVQAFRERFDEHPGLFGVFLREPVVRGLHEDMIQLNTHIEALHLGTLDPLRRSQVVQDAQRVSKSTRRLYNALQELHDEVT
jgi:hypothetical protein